MPYHEAVGEDLDPVVSEGGGGELEVSEMAGEDLSAEREKVVQHVDDHGGSSEGEEKLHLDGGG